MYAFTAINDFLVLFQAGKGGELTHDETTIISGALDLTEKVLDDINLQFLTSIILPFLSVVLINVRRFLFIVTIIP